MTALEKWAREGYGKAAGKPDALRKALFQTSSGVGIEPLYSPPEPPAATIRYLGVRTKTPPGRVARASDNSVFSDMPAPTI